MSTTPNSALYVDPSTGALSTGAVQFRNRLINGDMRIDQRLAGAANASLTSGADTYTADRWAAWRNAAGNYSVQRVSNATAPGNVYALQATVTTATSPVSTDTYFLHQKIEGFNVADFGLGTASATAFTISFYVNSSVAGTYSFVCQNSARNRSYVTTYVISAANTWQYKTITIQGDTAGTWLKDTSTGLDCMWTLGYGSSAGTASGNTWLASSAYGLTGTTQWINNASATFAVSNVQVERGAIATPFEVRPIQSEIKLCQRYFELFHASSGGSTTSGYIMMSINWTTKRALPVATKVSTTRETGVVSGSSYFEDITINGCTFTINTASTGLVYSVLVGRADCEV